MKKRRGRAFWERLVALAEAESEPRSQLAKRHRVSLGTLQGWIYRLRRERHSDGGIAAASPLRLVPITLTSPIPTRRLSIRLADCPELSFDEGAAPEYVASLVAAIARSSS